MDQLTIPNKLYGRDLDIVTLLESFRRISSGRGEVLLVPGLSGVGKTALVHELQMPVRDGNGFFISGKFDQYQQNIPYFAFRQALAQLCRELQSEDTQQGSQWKADILQSVGNVGQILVDLVPEFESFLGAQPPLEEISAQEARHRFTHVFRNLLKVVCRPEHPLVLFIDDWQWADAASCELLKQMQVGTTLRYMLLVAAYRDNEVEISHPLMSAVDDLRSQTVPVEVLQVDNITADDVRELVADTLDPAAEDIEKLAAIIHGKTLGNPFFVRSFLGFLHEVHLIWFDLARNYWRWRIDKIGEADLPDNVVDLFVVKLRGLDTDSQNLFSLAACLGNRFDLETLSLISGRDPRECLALLFSDQAKKMLQTSDAGRMNAPAEDLLVPKVCTFLHDRVQQAAYSLIAPPELPNILLKIGRMLLTSLHPEQLDERMFEVVSDLNAGCHLMRDTAEQVKAVELNITAGRKAHAAAAYSSALQFYRAASCFLESPGLADYLWRDYHELGMRLFKERAECEFLEGNHAQAENCIRQALAHAGTAIEKAATLNILIVQYTLLAKYPEAIAAGRQALAALGIELPEEGFEEARDAEIAQVRQELGNRLVSSLVELPVMSHPEMLMASKLLITMGPPCYRSHQRLWSVIVPKVVNLTLRYGNIPQVGYSHTAFGGLLGWVDNDYAMAKEFGELATHLMTGTFRSPSDQSVFYLMIGSSIRHWFKHLRSSTQDYTDAYEIGLRSGNLQYAAYAFGHNMYCRFYQGVPLAGLMRETQRFLEFSRTRRNQWAIDLLEGGLNIFSSLSGDSPALNGDDAWSEEEFLKQVEDHRNIQVTCIYKVLKMFALLVSGDHDGALALSDATEPLVYTVGTQGLLPWPEHVFSRLLILTALYSKADAKQQDKWRTELELMLGRLRLWAANCPENFEHKYLLAAAELARIDSRPAEAMRLYDQAVEAARAGDFLQWEGMVNERAYRFWLECGNERLAHVYWQQAYYCYDRWGAAAKVCSMETAFRTDLAQTLPGGDGSDQPAETQEWEIANTLVERQIKQLRNDALQMRQARLRIEAATQAEELADAMQRVRAEIAERKRAENRLQVAMEAAEKAVRAKSVFLANMSHELRTPLNAILGFSRLMQDDASMSSDQRQTLDIINRSSEHLFYLINDVLDMAKTEAGRDGVGNAPFDLNGMVRDITDLMRGRAEEKSLELLLEYSSECPHVVRVDGPKLRQVLLNLLSNAIKFTARGKVILRFSALPSDVPQRMRLIIEVEDTGIGIAAEDLAQIFEPFMQVGGLPLQKGTGLGLAIARQQAELMGGWISVESAPGEGSLFRVEVPVERVEASEVAAAKTDPGRVVGLAPSQPVYRILIVEDQMENWLLMQRLLEGVGFQVRVAQNGAAGIEMFQTWRPHFVWMDIRMPVMGGLEATRHIRELEGGRDVKIVAVTAAVSKEERDNIMAAGMDDFLRKPYRPEEIFECLTRQLGVAFILREASSVSTMEPAAALRPEALAALPDGLRRDLTDALIGLDVGQIAGVIQRICELDPALGEALGQHASAFRYTAILQAVRA